MSDPPKATAQAKGKAKAATTPLKAAKGTTKAAVAKPEPPKAPKPPPLKHPPMDRFKDRFTHANDGLVPGERRIREIYHEPEAAASKEASGGSKTTNSLCVRQLKLKIKDYDRADPWVSDAAKKKHDRAKEEQEKKAAKEKAAAAKGAHKDHKDHKDAKTPAASPAQAPVTPTAQPAKATATETSPASGGVECKDEGAEPEAAGDADYKPGDVPRASSFAAANLLTITNGPAPGDSAGTGGLIPLMPAIQVKLETLGYTISAECPILWRLQCSHVFCRTFKYFKKDSDGSFSREIQCKKVDAEWRGRAHTDGFVIFGANPDGVLTYVDPLDATKESATLPDQAVVGGHAILSVAVKPPSATAWLRDHVHLRIRGAKASNPKPADVDGSLSRSAPKLHVNVRYMFLAILEHEALFKQFDTPCTNHAEHVEPDPPDFPVVAWDFGYGITQYTELGGKSGSPGQVVTREMVWDFRANVIGGLNLFLKEKIPDAVRAIQNKSLHNGKPWPDDVLVWALACPEELDEEQKKSADAYTQAYDDLKQADAEEATLKDVSATAKKKADQSEVARQQAEKKLEETQKALEPKTKAQRALDTETTKLAELKENKGSPGAIAAAEEAKKQRQEELNKATEKCKDAQKNHDAAEKDLDARKEEEKKAKAASNDAQEDHDTSVEARKERQEELKKAKEDAFDKLQEAFLTTKKQSWKLLAVLAWRRYNGSSNDAVNYAAHRVFVQKSAKKIKGFTATDTDEERIVPADLLTKPTAGDPYLYPAGEIAQVAAPARYSVAWEPDTPASTATPPKAAQ